MTLPRRALLALAGLAGCSPLDLLNATIATRGLDVSSVPYLPDGNPRHGLDRYRAAARAQPLVVFFYGGSWQEGRRQDYVFVGAELARAGVMTAVCDYRVYPEVRYPEFLTDAAAGVRFCLNHARDWGADPDRVFVAGHSAGAYIAAMLALDPHWLGEERLRIAGTIGISGPYDFLPLTRPDIRAVFGSAQDDPVSQPIHHADGSNRPLLLLTGGADTTVEPRNTLALAAAVRAAGGTVQTRVYPGVDHAGTVAAFAPLLRHTAPTLRDVAAFVRG